ncbi:phage tail assembly protein [Dissulfurirhabdus thermomarina]|uniref:Phage tail assembly protein n=1 Tax=Dissulfurirhabdus thermomarina TaxID=1765737 RepID=A0A6N9TJJ6_DISTH|nr:phage tail assembly protein [Dissulfurirhabdus thermomarina]NDY41249.1 phage tail assembly protein [Dissulfurirhabdus thermomarina]
MADITIPLAEPIRAHGEEVRELRIRTPRGRDFKRLEASAMDAPFRLLLDFAALLADVPPSALDDLGPEDVAKVVEAVGPFFCGSLGIGRTS